MKPIRLLLFIWLIIFVNESYSQDSCKVLADNLKGIYSGKCKNGLAHGIGYASGIDTYIGSFKKGYPDGEGRYIWASGAKYEGKWKMGKRNGLGKYFSYENNIENIKEGIWLNDEYQGQKKIEPRIIKEVNISSARIAKLGEGNKIIIKQFQNSMLKYVEYDFLEASSGNKYLSGNFVGYENISFPFKCKITYYCWNTMVTVRLYCTFEFEITDPGSYEIKITNL